MVHINNKKVVTRRVGILVAAHLLAIAALFWPTAPGVGLFVLFHLLTGCFGISLGFHRLLAHRSYSVPRWLRLTWAALGTLAMQGGPLSWVAIHRAHHRFDGRPGDAHAATRGFAWSHVGWTLFQAPNGFRFRRLKEQVPDLASDPALVWMERHQGAMNLALAAVVALVFGLPAMLWAVPLRIVLVWHTTWLINSLAHSAPMRADDSAVPAPRNIRWLSVISYGEGLHRNHHDAPNSPAFSRSLRDGDTGYGILRAMAATRIVRFDR